MYLVTLLVAVRLHLLFVFRWILNGYGAFGMRKRIIDHGNITLLLRHRWARANQTSSQLGSPPEGRSGLLIRQSLFCLSFLFHLPLDTLYGRFMNYLLFLHSHLQKITQPKLSIAWITYMTHRALKVFADCILFNNLGLYFLNSICQFLGSTK